MWWRSYLGLFGAEPIEKFETRYCTLLPRTVMSAFSTGSGSAQEGARHSGTAPSCDQWPSTRHVSSAAPASTKPASQVKVTRERTRRPPPSLYRARPDAGLVSSGQRTGTHFSRAKARKEKGSTSLRSVRIFKTTYEPPLSSYQLSNP